MAFLVLLVVMALCVGAQSKNFTKTLLMDEIQATVSMPYINQLLQKKSTYIDILFFVQLLTLSFHRVQCAWMDHL